MAGKGKDWFPNDKATHEWLNSMKKGSRYTYQSHWKYFLEFTGMTGDQILGDRKSDQDYKWEKKVIEFKQWMIEQKKKAPYTAASATGAVRSFFAIHRLDLQFRRTESVKLTEARRKYEDYRFSREDLKKMADVADLTEQYVVVVGKSCGLRAGDFLKMTRGDLEAYIDREPPISIGEYATEKESVPAYPFIDSDAKPVIKLMVEKMDREGRKDPGERMLKYKHEIQLTRVLKRIAKRAGIKHGNKVIRFHCLRKFLIDRLSSHMSTEKWKQIVGKAISEGAYVSPDSLRTDYERTMSETTFPKVTVKEGDVRIKSALDQLRLSGKFPEEYIRELENEWIGKEPEIAIRKIGEEAEAIERIADRQGLSVSELIKSSRYLISKDVIKEEIEEIKKERARRRSATNGGSLNCQKIVSEEELPTLLTEGWRVAAVLPSGKVVVER